jgi:hypothetical protein
LVLVYTSFREYKMEISEIQCWSLGNHLQRCHSACQYWTLLCRHCSSPGSGQTSDIVQKPAARTVLYEKYFYFWHQNQNMKQMKLTLIRLPVCSWAVFYSIPTEWLTVFSLIHNFKYKYLDKCLFCINRLFIVCRLFYIPYLELLKCEDTSFSCDCLRVEWLWFYAQSKQNLFPRRHDFQTWANPASCPKGIHRVLFLCE